MKITVYHRNPAAREDLQHAKDQHNEVMKDLREGSRRPEPPKWKGFVAAEDIDAVTVEDIQTTVLEKLLMHPISDGYEPAKDNIWVFERQEQNERCYASRMTGPGRIELGIVGGDYDLNRVVGHDDIKMGGVYYAFEVFDDTVPCDLFKMVPHFWATPATLCNPERRCKTKIAPLALTTSSPYEPSFPWQRVDEDGDPIVRGIPLSSKETDLLFCADVSLPITDKKWNPTITATQQPGVKYKIPLHKYEMLLNSVRGYDESSTYDPIMGILSHLPANLFRKEANRDDHNYIPAMFEVQGEALARYTWSETIRTLFAGVHDASSPLVRMRGKEGTLLKLILSFVVPYQSRLMQQELLFGFKLKRGTSLRQHGMAVVIDNSDEEGNHCSLVRLNEASDQWDTKTLYHHDRCRLFSRPADVDVDVDDDEGLTRYLSPTKDHQPEVFYDWMLEGRVYPLVAAQFQLDHVVVRAWAEPFQPQGHPGDHCKNETGSDDDEDDEDSSVQDQYEHKMCLYRAMLALFHEAFRRRFDRTSIFHAIQLLEAEDYHPAGIHSHRREILIDAMQSELDQYHNGEPHGYELEILFNPAIEILEAVDDEEENVEALEE